MSDKYENHLMFTGQYAVISDIESFFKSKGIPAEVQIIIRASLPPKAKAKWSKRASTDNLKIIGGVVKVAKTFIEYLLSKPSGTLIFKTDKTTEVITNTDSPQKVEKLIKENRKTFFQIDFKL